MRFIYEFRTVYKNQQFFIRHSTAFSLLLTANRLLTACGFLPLSIITMSFNKKNIAMLISFIAIPALCFLAVTIFRKVVNKKRPYEKLPIQSLIKKIKRPVFSKPPCVFYLFNRYIMVLLLETCWNLSFYCWCLSFDCQSNWRGTFRN